MKQEIKHSSRKRHLSMAATGMATGASCRRERGPLAGMHSGRRELPSIAGISEEEIPGCMTKFTGAIKKIQYNTPRKSKSHTSACSVRKSNH